MEDKKETALEGPVQEQTIVFSFNKEKLNEKLEKIEKLKNELIQEVNSLSDAITYQNS